MYTLTSVLMRWNTRLFGIILIVVLVFRLQRECFKAIQTRSALLEKAHIYHRICAIRTKSALLKCRAAQI